MDMAAVLGVVRKGVVPPAAVPGDGVAAASAEKGARRRNISELKVSFAGVSVTLFHLASRHGRELH